MRIECFIDADNIPCPSAEGWGAELEAELVGCRHRRAYGVGKTIGTELSRWLYTHNFEVIDAFSPVSGKNSADIRMTLGIAERALGGERGAEGAARFVIVSGDSDFTPVLSKLHEWGHELCLVAPDGHLASAAERIGAKVIRIRAPQPPMSPAPAPSPTPAPSPAPAPSPNPSALLHASPLLPRLFDIIRKALSAHPGGLPLVNLAARLNNEVGAYWYQPLGFKKLLNALYALNNLSPSPLLTLQPTGAGDYLALPPPPVILPPAPAAPAPLANPSLTDAPPQPSAEEATALLWGFLSHGAYAKLPHIHQKLCERYPHFSYKALGYSKLHIYLSSLSALDLDLSTPNQARLRSPSAPASLLSGS